MPASTEIQIEKIKSLPPDRLAEVEDFVDLIRTRDRERTVTRETAATSVFAFAAIWSNPEDDVYDAI
jgi:hypothetical protein